jgi:hypothetical protein
VFAQTDHPSHLEKDDLGFAYVIDSMGRPPRMTIINERGHFYQVFFAPERGTVSDR